MDDFQTVTQGRKFAQVIGAATNVFLRDGFARASVDDIARTAQVSKATIYSYFPEKSLMFRVAMQEEMGKLEFQPRIDPAIGPELGLPRLAEQIAVWVVDPQQLRLARVMMTESGRFPGLARTCLDHLSRLLRDRTRAFLDIWNATGSLTIDDTDAAAGLLVDLAGSRLRETALFCHLEVDARQAVHKSAADAATLFLRAYATQTYPVARISIARG